MKYNIFLMSFMYYMTLYIESSPFNLLVHNIWATINHGSIYGYTLEGIKDQF